jgi:hypothetical protein
LQRHQLVRGVAPGAVQPGGRGHPAIQVRGRLERVEEVVDLGGRWFERHDRVALDAARSGQEPVALGAEGRVLDRAPVRAGVPVEVAAVVAEQRPTIVRVPLREEKLRARQRCGRVEGQGISR